MEIVRCGEFKGWEFDVRSREMRVGVRVGKFDVRR